MAISSLFDNFVGPPSADVAGSLQTLGINFTVDNDVDVLSLSFYRHATGATNKPSNLSLWSRSTTNRLADLDTLNDDGTVGWQSTNLPAPVTLIAGVTYTVSGLFPSGNGYAYVAPGSLPSAGTHFAFSANARAYIVGSDAYPSNVDNARAQILNVTITDASDPPPGDEPATTQDLENALTRWFASGSDNTRTDQLPKLTHDLAADAATAAETVEVRTAGLTGGTIQAAINAAVTALKGAGTATLTAIETAVGALQLSADALGLAMDALGLAVDASAAAFNAWIAGSGNAVAQPGTGWVLADSGAFDGAFEVAERCDRVYVAFADVETTGRHYEQLGHLLWSEVWWWEPVFGGYGGNYISQRNTEAVLYVPGMRMDGVRVHVSPERSGTWEAWRFDG